jgi:hypothetical protein
MPEIMNVYIYMYLNMIYIYRNLFIIYKYLYVYIYIYKFQIFHFEFWFSCFILFFHLYYNISVINSLVFAIKISSIKKYIQIYKYAKYRML